LARYPSSSDDSRWKLYLLCGRLVDLALYSKFGIMISKETLFAISLFPYLGFLWFLTRSGKTPRLALIGFYMTLVFVAVTIPAGIYAKIHYGRQLADVDWLHGSAESFLTLSNILVVLGFRQALIEKKPPVQKESN
jgi:hypothetical protein